MNVYLGGPTSQQVTNYVPQMTADTQDGYTATCSTQLNSSDFSAWMAFYVSTQGGSPTYAFHSNNIGSGNRGWSQIQLPKGIIVNKIEIGARKNESSSNLRPIGAFSLKGSNDGSTWTEIKAVSGLGNSWSIGSVQSWNITGQTTAYTYLKLEVQAYSTYVAFDYWNIDGVVEETKVVKNVYIGDYTGWQPGENTVAYYPLKEDFNDHKGSGTLYNLTNNGGSLTTLSGVQCAYFSLSSIASNSSPSFGGIRTISHWINANSNSENSVLVWTGGSGGVNTTVFSSTLGGGITPGCSNMYNQGYSISDNISFNTWYYIVATIGNGEGKVYLNGVLKGTWSFSVGNGTGIYLSRRGDGITSNSRYDGYLSEVIIEDKVRTAEEIQSYYNQTKSNYGL